MTFKDHKITRNISVSETTCQCNCGMGFFPGDIKDDTISNIFFLAQNIQILINHLEVFCQFPEYVKLFIKITSWCRCHIHNRREGGATNSVHKSGGAVDLKIYYRDKYNKIFHLEPWRISRASLLLNKQKITSFGGIGCYHNRTHLDVREGNVVTWYKKNKGLFENKSKYLYGVDFTKRINFD